MTAVVRTESADLSELGCWKQRTVVVAVTLETTTVMSKACRDLADRHQLKGTPPGSVLFSITISFATWVRAAPHSNVDGQKVDRLKEYTAVYNVCAYCVGRPALASYFFVINLA